jgi:hypothetical protein
MKTYNKQLIAASSAKTRCSFFKSAIKKNTFYHGFKFLLTGILIGMVFCTVTANASDGLKKYQSLINAVDKAEGRAVLYLSSGYFTCSLNHKSYLINTDPQNADIKKVEVKFKYANGSIISLKIRFLPAIHVALLGNRCISLAIDSLTFDEDGDRIDEQCGYHWDNPHCTAPNTSQLLDLLNPNLDYAQMFSGTLFQNCPKFIASDFNGTPVAPQLFIYRILFNDPSNTGLLATFKQGKEWTISEKQYEGVSNVVAFNSSSVVNFKRIDYNLLEKTLEVKLDNARFNLLSGHFESGNIALDLQNNTDLNIGNISFSQNGSDFEFQYSGATLTGNVSAGSSLTLSNKTLSKLVFDTGSHIGLQGLDFDLTNSNLDFSFEAGSVFNLHILTGNLPIGDNGSVSLDKSFLDIDLAANYSKGNSFSTIGSIINADLNIASGKIFFNGAQEPLLVRNGTIRAKNIIINSQVFPYLTGAFDFVQFTCEYGSELSIKNSISFKLNPGSVLTFGDRNFPFTLIANEKFPIGRMNAIINFDNFKNHKLGSLSVGNGTANGNFRFIQGENCLVDSLSLSGSFALNFNVQNTPLKGNGTFSLRNGSLQYVDGQPMLGAIVGIKISKGSDYYNIGIPGNYDDANHIYIEKDRTTQYPVTIGLKLAADINIPESKITFKQNLITLDAIDFSITANLMVPGGNGEREYPDGHFNGDSGSGKQEVARFDCPDPSGVMHFYLNPVDAGHHYTANVKVSIGGNQQQDIAISLHDLTLDRPLEYETVGCTGFFKDLFAIVAGSISGVICGPCSLPVAVIAYIKAGDLVNGIIQGKIYSFMQDFNKTVVIK